MSIVVPPDVRISLAGRERLDREAAKVCEVCERSAFRLCRRQKADASWTIEVQCVECGRSTVQPLKRSDHADWQHYPVFDAALWERTQQQRAVRRQEFADRQSEYNEWLRTSQEWRALSGRVRTRARNWCEACLLEPAAEVHHLTYALGRLPPAWQLRAVCRGCHERFHTIGDDWGPSP